MENKLILEISRLHEIMGINPGLTIKESWGWLDDLIRNSPKVFKNFDEILKLTREGLELSDEQIDNIVDSIKSAGKLTNDEANQLKNLLKNDDQVRRLLNTTDDFLTDLKKIYPDGKAPDALYPLTKVSQLSSSQVDQIVASTVKRAVQTSGTRASKLLSSFETTYYDYLDSILKNKEFINNVDEIYDVMDDKLLAILDKNVKAGNITEDVAKNLYNELSSKFRTSQKIRNKITELESNGRILNNPKTTTSKKWGDAPSNQKFDDIKVKNQEGTVQTDPSSNNVSRKKTSSLVGEDGKPIETIETLPDNISNKYNNLKNKSPQELTATEKEFIDKVEKWKSGENNIDDINKSLEKVDSEFVQGLEENLDDPNTWGPMLDDVGELTPKWSDIFFTKMFQGPWGETLVNMFRGAFRKPEQFVIDAKQTLSSIEKKYRLLTELNFGDALYKKTESELDNLTARLKSDMMLSQTKEQMFITQWKTIQKSIESSLDYGTARRLIDKLGKSGDPRVSIDAFVAWTEKNAKNVTFLDVIKRYKTFGEYMSDTNIAKWSKEYKEVWAKEAVYLQKVKSTLMLILSDLIQLLLQRLPNLLTFGVFSLRKELLELLKGTGRLSGLGGVKNVMMLYIRVTLISNFVHPIINFVINSFGAGLEFIPGFEDINLEKKTVLLQAQEDFKQRIPILGNDFEWNPFYNPVPKNAQKWRAFRLAGLPYIEAEDIGFKPAPLPNLIFEGLDKLFNKDTSVDQVKKLEDETRKGLEQKLNDFYKNMTPEAKEELKNASNYNNLKVLNLQKPEDVEFYGLTNEEAKTISEHMYYKIGVQIPQPKDAPKEETQKIDLKTFQPNIDNILGQTWICSTKPKTVDGVDSCDGESWRVLIYNDRYLDGDSENFKKFIDSPKNDMARKYVYVSNRAVENEPKPNVGTNNKNLKPIKDLLPKLK